MTVETTSTDLKLLTSDQLVEEYQQTIDSFFDGQSRLKKHTVFRMRDILLAQGFPKHRISSQITRDLRGEVNDRYIRELLGKDYTDPAWVRDQSSPQQNQQQIQSSSFENNINPPVVKEMDKNQLRNFKEYLKLKQQEVDEEMGERQMAQLGTTEGTLPNRAVTNTPLHDQQITKPKYKDSQNGDEKQKEWQDMIAYECREISATFAKMADEFIPSIKIESEAQARRWANGLKAIHSLFIPGADQKYRLSLQDWVKIIKIMRVHGSSAASKLFKKPVASIHELDPESLPEGFDRTLLAMKIDKQTDQVVFISPTKEHLDSRVNIMLEAITYLINNMGGMIEFLEMLESDIKLRNFRASVLSEKLGDSK